ncbi:undecaprenyl-phosphate glucose phosphotransferase [Botryobacter ruber]|uniref:undecaprenyl-phosphate glucose phosphotransferase n=1 Tax=Botryobacter ruber TaxID=2171629 RepID=UPI000E0B7F21|nr:undecaprenyl-phosphate glucose phosphotransferase [Botryobacter ruber]
MNTSRQIHPSFYLGGDMLTLLLTFLVSLHFFNDSKNPELEWSIFAGFLLLWFVIGYWRNLYFSNFYNRFSARISSYIKAYFILLGLVFLSYILFSFPVPDREVMAAFVVGFPILGVSVNYLILKAVNQVKNIPNETKYALVAGVGNPARYVEKEFYSNPAAGYRIKGFINCKKNEQCLVEQERVVGNLDSMRQFLKDNPVDEIVIALPVKTSKKVRNIIEAADYHGIRVKYIPDYQGLLGKHYKPVRVGQLDAVDVRHLPLDEKFSFYLKNAFDKVFALAALTMLAPVFLVLAILIKLESPGPAFYCPTRIGKGGKPFKVYKFRSMRQNDAATGGTLSTQKDDARITGTGKFIRKYSIDELPQFINVLLGDMSVVGPRPHRSFLNQQFQESEDKYMIRHYFKPGITGWAQVNGWRGPTDTKEQRNQRTVHDLWYVENWSLLLDIKIIYLTVFGKKVHNNAF